MMRRPLQGEQLDFKADLLAAASASKSFKDSNTIQSITIQVEPSERAMRTLFSFDTVTRVKDRQKHGTIPRDRFRRGTGFPHASLGDVSFTDASLFGTIKLDTKGSQKPSPPRSMPAAHRTRATSSSMAQSSPLCPFD